MYGCRATLTVPVNEADGGAFPECLSPTGPPVLKGTHAHSAIQSHANEDKNQTLKSSTSRTLRHRVGEVVCREVTLTNILFQLQRQSQSSVSSGIKRTHDALNSIKDQNPRLAVDAAGSDSPEYIKYSKNTSERVIKLHDVVQDPLAPPKFRQKKVW